MNALIVLDLSLLQFLALAQRVVMKSPLVYTQKIAPGNGSIPGVEAES